MMSGFFTMPSKTFFTDGLSPPPRNAESETTPKTLNSVIANAESRLAAAAPSSPNSDMARGTPMMAKFERNTACSSTPFFALSLTKSDTHRNPMKNRASTAPAP